MKRLDVDVPYCVREYRSGRSAKELARELRISSQVIYRRLAEAGVTVRRHPHRHSLPVQEMARAYVSGLSENALAERYGVDRNVVRRRLIEAGASIRGRSEAEALKWSRMSTAVRKRQVAAAHQAARGRRHTLAEKMLRASVVQAKGLHRSPSEDALGDMLRARGIETIAQQAIGPYNCDLGAAPVAVEVFGGEWHWNGRHLLRTPRRFRYIMKAGWHLLIVHVTPRRFPLTEATADYVAAYVKRMRRQPTARREYRVIRATGELEAAGGVDDEKIAIIPALTLGRDATTGRYKSLPR